jgi:predicted phosphodiesterase
LGEKRAKVVAVFGGDDKRSISTCFSSFADGALLPFQFIFQRTTKRVLPKTRGTRIGLSHGFHFTMTNNHCSNLESMQEFVNFILVPYLDNEVQKLNLSSPQ